MIDAFRARCAAAATLLVLAVFGVGEPASAQLLNFRHYSTIDGLPQIQVHAMHQDQRGYFWFATYGGVTRYDGGSFRTYTVDEGLRSNTVRAVTEDGAGRLVVGTTGGGICTYLGGRFRCVPGVDNVEIRAVIAGAPGEIWAAADHMIMRLRGDTIATFRIPAARWTVNGIARDAQGHIWVATSSGLERVDGQRLVSVATQQVGDLDIRVVLPSPRGILLVASDGTSLLGNGETFERLPVRLVPPNALPQAAAIDAAGTFWIATTAGVVRYDTQGAVRLLTRANGLVSNQAQSVEVDREGNVWIGTEYGASKLVPGPFAQLTTTDGLPNGFVRAVTLDRAGRLWAGTRFGLAYLENDRFHTVDLGSGVTDRRIYALAALPGGEMLVGLREGLVRLGPGGTRRYTSADGLPSAAVGSLLPMPDGSVWIGTRRGIAIWRNGRIEPLKIAEAATEHVIVMARDSAGRVWAGLASNGLLLIEADGSAATRIGRDQGMSEQTVWSIATDARGHVWVGTNGSGVYVFDRAQGNRPVHHFTRRDGLVNEFVWQVLHDRHGDAWVYTSHGLDRYRDGSFRHYGRGDGLVDLEGSTHSALEDSGGTLWFGTGTGLVRYIPALDVPVRIAPPVYVDGLTVGDAPIEMANARFQPGAGVMQVRYAAPSFRDESATRFRYRLLGANDVWSELTEDRVIRYASLAPGHYEFQVTAVSGDDIASPVPASVSFTVLPAYWQTWWFRTLIVLAVILVLVASARIRLRWLESERLRLEGLVRTHTHRLTEQNERLAREVTDRLAVEGALRESEQRVRDIIEHSTNLFFAHTVDHELIYASPQARVFLDCEPEEMLKRWTDFVTDHPVNQAGIEATQRAIETGEKQPTYQLELRGLSGRLIWVDVNEAPVVRDGVTVAMVGSLTDITEAKRAAEASERLETQLRQAQKMEAVGRLAGGIAHDFNNLLTVIVGNAQLMGETIGDEHPLAEELAETRRAADRAAGLVAQLLAFSRKQLVKPATLDINAVVSDAARMLRRLIGTDIELRLDLADPAPLINADRTQLDQVLINLAVNARDAMHDGGTLNIATSVVTLDAAVPEEGGDVIAAGCYVLLTVADNGVGMDADTRSHAFEPFFTTRDVGQGTGLGLATVYGVVKQSGGAIRLESEPGGGTTFRIYLPPASADCADGVVTRGVTERTDRCSGDDRVVLVVEDENGVRDYVCRTLRRIGYRVLSASDGAAALAISDEHSDVIHLLLTDMIMPGMNGKIVADQIVARRPDTRVLYMSGYTRDALGERGVCDPSTRFLQKPFTPSDLAAQVERALA